MGGAETLRAKKKKRLIQDAVKCSKFNGAFSGEGVKVSAATVSQASDDTGPNRVTFPYCKSKHISGKSLCSKVNDII